jgi:hypothetical protein
MKLSKLAADLPRHHDPSSNDSRKHNASANADVLWAKVDHIVRTRDDVCRQVDTNLRDAPSESNEEGSSAAS